MQILLDNRQRISYRQSLRLFEEERQEYQSEIARLDLLIESIKRKLGDQPADEPNDEISSEQSDTVKTLLTSIPKGAYSQMGMRDAILELFRTNPGIRLETSEVTAALLQGGVKSGAAKVNQAVSATLSAMRSKHGEIQSENGRYFLVLQEPEQDQNYLDLEPHQSEEVTNSPLEQ